MIKFKTWECVPIFAYYENGRVAIILKTSHKAVETIAVATINIPEFDLPENHVLIKNWSENEGMLKALIDANLIEDTGERIPTGFCHACLCRLKVNLRLIPIS